MMIARRLLTGIGVLGMVIGISGCATTPGKQKMDAAVDLMQQGRFIEAEPIAREALQAAEAAALQTGGQPLNVAVSRYNLGEVALRLGKYPDAVANLQQAISLFESLEKPPQLRAVRTMASLGAAYTAQRRYEEAESTFRRGLDRIERAGGGNSGFAALYYSYLSRMYLAQGQLLAAEPAIRRAMSIREGKPDTADDLLYNLDDLGRLKRLQGDLPGAEPLIRRALAGKEKVLPPGHPFLADTADNLAELYAAQKRYGDAEPLYVRVLQIREKALPADHPDLAIVLEQYSVLLRQTNRESEATTMEGRAQAIRQRRASQGL